MMVPLGRCSERHRDRQWEMVGVPEQIRLLLGALGQVAEALRQVAEHRCITPEMQEDGARPLETNWCAGAHQGSIVPM